MALTDLVKAAQGKQVQVSTVVSLCVEYLGRSAAASATINAISKMDNEQKQEFAKGLLDLIIATHQERDETKKKAAEQELVALFGDDVLNTEAVQRSRDGFFFSLTADGGQFRVWYAPFGSVTHCHFDSCGTGCALSVHCADPGTLKQWLIPLVEGRAEWKSDHFGRIWIGYTRW